MANGGYQVIDFGGAVLGTTAKTFAGAYKKASAGKAVLIENVKFNADMTPVSGFAAPILTSDGYTLTVIASGLAGIQAVVITIADDDDVTAAFATLVVDE